MSGNKKADSPGHTRGNTTLKIGDTSFGSITVGGERYEHDIFISLDGRVKKRKKRLSKEVYGTSHKISLDEIRYVYQEGCEGIVIGTGQYGIAHLSDEALEFLDRKGCKTILKATPEAIREWNGKKGKWLGLFHITC
jgi:hypothetical protein